MRTLPVTTDSTSAVRITPIRVAVFEAIVAAQGRNGEARITQRQLAEQVGTLLKNVNAAVRALSQAGWIVAIRIGRRMVYKVAPAWARKGNNRDARKGNNRGRRSMYTRASVRSEVLRAEGQELFRSGFAPAGRDAASGGAPMQDPNDEERRGTDDTPADARLFAGFEAPPVPPRPLDARDVVRAYLDELGGERPPRNAVGQVAASAKRLIGEGFPAAEVVAAARELVRRGRNPLGLADALMAVRRTARARAGGDPIVAALSEVAGFRPGDHVPDRDIRLLLLARADLIDVWATWIVNKGRLPSVDEARAWLEREAATGSPKMREIVLREAARIRDEFGSQTGVRAVVTWFYKPIERD